MSGSFRPKVPEYHLAVIIIHYGRQWPEMWCALKPQISISNLSVTSSTSQLILQLFSRFTYVTAHSPTLPLLHLRHNSFSNPSFASPTSQALNLRHLASRPWINVNNNWMRFILRCSASFSPSIWKMGLGWDAHINVISMKISEGIQGVPKNTDNAYYVTQVGKLITVQEETPVRKRMVWLL